MAVGNGCANALIGIGVSTLLITAVMTFGYNSMLKTVLPITMASLPMNETLQAWTDVPMPIHAKANLQSVSISTNVQNQTLGKGHMAVRIELSSWVDGHADVFPIIWIEKAADLSQLVRYVMVLSDGPFNFAKYWAWAIAFVAFAIAVYATRLECRRRKED